MKKFYLFLMVFFSLTMVTGCGSNGDLENENSENEDLESVDVDLHKVTFYSSLTAPATYFIDYVFDEDTIDSFTPFSAGREFVGWYTSSNLTFEYNFDLPVSKDLDLYPKFNELNLVATVEEYGFTYKLYDNNEAYLHEGLSLDTRINIEEQITYNNIEYAVTALGEWSLINCYNLEKLDIPDSIKSIGDLCFPSESLTEITIGANVEYIDPSAFDILDVIEEYRVHGANEHYSSYGGVLYNEDFTKLIAYPRASKLDYFEVHDNTNVISKNAFFLATNLEEVTLSTNTQFINECAFSYCNRLVEVNNSGNVLVINQYAFASSSIETFDNLENIKVIEKSSFEKCSYLKNLNEGNKIEFIGELAFNVCASLNNINLGNSLARIDKKAFAYCISLKTITIPVTTIYIGSYSFLGCENLVIYTLLDSKPDSWDSTWDDFLNIESSEKINVKWGQTA